MSKFHVHIQICTNFCHVYFCTCILQVMTISLDSSLCRLNFRQAPTLILEIILYRIHRRNFSASLPLLLPALAGGLVPILKTGTHKFVQQFTCNFENGSVTTGVCLPRLKLRAGPGVKRIGLQQC